MPPSPFIPEIVNLKTPWGYQNPKFHVYDGKSDPFAHVRQYRNAMSFHCGEDKLLCNVFPRSLGDMGSEWFEKLPPGSISIFDQVAGLFTQRFMTNQNQTKRMDALHTMIRGKTRGFGSTPRDIGTHTTLSQRLPRVRLYLPLRTGSI